MALDSFEAVPGSAYSFETEQAVLGSVLVQPECFTTVSLYIKSEYFYFPQHREIYKIMQDLDFQTGTVDLLMILDRLRKSSVFSGDEDGKTYLYQLSQAVPSAANVESYCRVLQDKYYLRALSEASFEILEMTKAAQKSSDELLNLAESKIYNIRQGNAVEGPASLASIIPTVYDMLYKLNSKDPAVRAELHGLPTGFPDFDRVCSGGLGRSDLVIIGARPAMGKTSFALNMARNVAVSTNKKVLFFSLEMSKEQLAQRIISTEARIPSQKMRTGDLTKDEWEKMSSACLFLAKVPLYFDDSSNVTVNIMSQRVRRLKDVCAVFVDYLQLMRSPEKKENRNQEVSDITRNLKLMAKDLHIPLVVCAQLSRGTEQRGVNSHKPQISDLRESGSIEQDADVVAMLYRESYYQNNRSAPKDDNSEAQEKPEQSVNTAELLIQKNRHGPTESVKLAWNPQFTLYTCITNDRNEQQ